MLKNLLHLLTFGLLFDHTWRVAWNDDDACRCGAGRFWPSGYTTSALTENRERRRLNRVNARY